MNPRLNALFYFSPRLTAYSQAQIELFFFFPSVSDLPFCCLLSYCIPPPSTLFFLCVCVCVLSLICSLTSPFFAIFSKVIWKKKKPSAAPFHFVLFQSRRPFLLSPSLRRLFRVLLFKLNEDHISSAWSYMAGRGGAGLLWENKYYGRSDFVILIWPGSMCV